MNQKELVAEIASKTDESNRQVEKILSATLEAITEALCRGDKVQLMGFGTFETKSRAARIGRNPRTGEEVAIVAKRRPTFRAGKSLKDKVE